jgi:membrane-bound ClpP family serine protease
MEKKYFDRKELKKIINSELEKGVSKSDLLQKLDEQYHEKDLIEKLLASITRPELRKQYATLNFILGIAGISLITLRVITQGFSIIGGGFMFFSLVLTFMVFRFEGVTYRLLGAFTAITTLLTVSKYEGNYLLFADLILSISVIGLAFHLGLKLFPNYGLYSPKKDVNGKLVLE